MYPLAEGLLAPAAVAALCSLKVRRSALHRCEGEQEQADGSGVQTSTAQSVANCDRRAGDGGGDGLLAFARDEPL